jgi:hypothetical protein
MNPNEREIIQVLIRELTGQGLEIVLFPQNSDLIDDPEELLELLHGHQETEIHVYQRRPDRTYKHLGTVGLRWGGTETNLIRHITPRLSPHIKQTEEVVARIRASIAVGK